MSRAARARSRYRLGVALVMLYGAVAAAYVVTGGRVRPLFDGFAPPPPYRWVNPPKEFAAGNDPPRPSTFDVALTATGSVQAGGSSEDGQVILSFAAGTFTPHAADTKVAVQVTPVDPATLVAPPTGLAADGNAYRLDFTYQPSGQDVTMLAIPADVFLVVPEPAQSLLFSSDGRAWESVPFRPVPDPTQIGGRFERPGYLLGVAPPVGRPSDLASDGSEASRLLQVGAVTLVIAAGLVLAPPAWRRIRPEKQA